MHLHDHSAAIIQVFEFIGGIVPFILLIFVYLISVYYTNQLYKNWPLYRILCWIFGVLCIAVSLIGPIADRAHTNFNVHMYTHLLLGMLGPLFIAFSAPTTLLLRTLPTNYARLISKVLKSTLVRMVSHPITASILNIGGLWLLYTTNLYSAMHDSKLLYFFIHLHVFLAGYLFTISLLYIDPTAHRTSFRIRATVLVLSMAGHSVLSKWIYAHPPTGVQTSEAQQGGVTMYYVGDLIDLVIVIAICYQYFRKKQPMKEKIIVT
ncbi:cytochrome c oxidase assembly protein [Ureibacillus sp. NPDC094379]